MLKPFREFLDYLAAHPGDVRPAALLMLPLIIIFVLFGGWQLVRTLRTLPAMYTWRMSARMVGWWGAAIGVALLAALFMIARTEQPRGSPFYGLTLEGALTFAIPLMTGLHAALLISLDDEPLLELQLTYQRPFRWLIAERLIVAIGLQVGIGLIGTGVAVAMQGGDFGRLVLTWLPASLLFAGIGARVTLSSKQIVFGGLAVIILWGITRLYTLGLVFSAPYLWPIHPFMPSVSLLYLRPDMLPKSDYLLNRGLLIVVGIAFMIAALAAVRDVEKVFSSVQKAKA